MQLPRFDSQKRLIARTWPDGVSWPQGPRPGLARVRLLAEVSLLRLDVYLIAVADHTLSPAPSSVNVYFQFSCVMDFK